MSNPKENKKIDKVPPPWYGRVFISENNKITTISTVILLITILINSLMPVKSLFLVGLMCLLIIICVVNGICMGVSAYYCLKTGYYKHL